LDSLLFAILSLVILYQGVLLYQQQKRYQNHLQEVWEHHNKERRDLLDRIQAPTFAEYTNKVIKEKKAEQKEEEKDTINFIS
jgi:hypothetical protein